MWLPVAVLAGTAYPVQQLALTRAVRLPSLLVSTTHLRHIPDTTEERARSFVFCGDWGRIAETGEGIEAKEEIQCSATGCPTSRCSSAVLEAGRSATPSRLRTGTTPRIDEVNHTPSMVSKSAGRTIRSTARQPNRPA